MGHIPSGPTAELTILTFREAFDAQDPVANGFDGSRWLYVPDYYLEYRYILGTKGDRPLICIGVNPSTARPGALDNTLQSVERISQANGFDSFIMFNVYPQRATVPDAMDLTRNERLHRENMEAFKYCLRQDKTGHPAVWAAWGTIIEKRPWLRSCVADMIAIGEGLRADWFTAGKRSIKGHPHHPLYLKKDSVLEPFAVADYVKTL